ncbi:hypothetical protein [Actinophytocola xanthii]|uniref:Uncharacterized protein n=1 Tax=Actinophytocola xanthii TaxID=1912961 RepID=A0A1Q8CGQ7_9PSEU|nr:hypothetical protein [Actinophytocola xanthii]OLF13524.1 hypothetical protein BU204_26840 [Actinophytocola xanthii]
MRSAESMPTTYGSHPLAVPAPWTPKSSARIPLVVSPHPPLAYPERPVGDRTAGAALLWTLLFGPLGLCYLAVPAGLVATALTATAVVLAGSALPLAVIWPLTMVLSVLQATSSR